MLWESLRQAQNELFFYDIPEADKKGHYAFWIWK